MNTLSPPEVMSAVDVVVIGAGPAGMAAATTCANAGLRTVLLDEQHGPGGQIYRAITHTPLQARGTLGPDYWEGERLVQALSQSAVQHLQGASVWNVSSELEVAVSRGGQSFILKPRHVIVATGAQERPFPIEGWTRPGVMTAGAAQILLKSSGVVPAGKTVLAGCGPLLWLLASQLLAAGARLEAVLDTTPKTNWLNAAAHAWEFVTSPYFFKGLALWLKVRTRVRVITGVTQLRAEGASGGAAPDASDGDRAVDALQRVVWQCDSSTEESMPVDTLLLHQGVVPQTNLAMAIGVKHRWDETQLCWHPEVDAVGQTALEGVSIAGDGAGIGGAWVAAVRGRLAALGVLRRLLGPAADATRWPDESRLRTQLQRLMRGRAFLDVLYQPGVAQRIPQGKTLVCRCEEITAEQIEQTVALGCPGPNQMKSFLRCGMGPCQGRLCSLTVTELMAQARGVSPQEVGHYRLRAPIKPITVGELASMPQNEPAVRAVVRM